MTSRGLGSLGSNAPLSNGRPDRAAAWELPGGTVFPYVDAGEQFLETLVWSSGKDREYCADSLGRGKLALDLRQRNRKSPAKTNHLLTWKVRFLGGEEELTQDPACLLSSNL